MGSMMSAFNAMATGVTTKPEFSQIQLAQFEMFKDDNLSTLALCKQHPEWDSVLMNSIMNNEKEGKDYEHLITYAKMFKPNEKGLIGDWATLEYLWALNMLEYPEEQIASLLNTVHQPGDTPCMVVYRILCHLGERNNRTGRIRLTEQMMNIDTVRHVILAEGNEDVLPIVEKIETMSGQFNAAQTREMWGTGLGSHLMPGIMDQLSLDDMNIRGNQILFAYEYADKSIETLCKLLSNRDEGLVHYINVQMAKTQGERAPKAVTNGASFTDEFGMGLFGTNDLGEYYIMEPMLSSLKAEEAKPLTRDWTNASIVNGTTKDEALRILEAFGFRVIYRNKDHWPLGCNGLEYIMFHNKQTGAIGYCKATDDDACYGGFEVVVPAEICGMSFDWQANAIDRKGDESKPVRYAHTITYQRDFIPNYKKCVETCVPISDTTVLRYGYEGIPIPEILGNANKFMCHRYTNPKLEGIMYNEAYSMSKVFDAMMVRFLYTQLAEEDKWLYKAFMDNFWENYIDVCYIPYDYWKHTIFMGVAFKVLGVPASEIDKAYQAAWKDAKEFDDRMKQNGYQQEVSRVASLESCKENLYGNQQTCLDLITEFGLDKAQFPTITF